MRVVIRRAVGAAGAAAAAAAAVGAAAATAERSAVAAAAAAAARVAAVPLRAVGPVLRQGGRQMVRHRVLPSLQTRLPYEYEIVRIRKRLCRRTDVWHRGPN